MPLALKYIQSLCIFCHLHHPGLHYIGSHLDSCSILLTHLFFKIKTISCFSPALISPLACASHKVKILSHGSSVWLSPAFTHSSSSGHSGLSLVPEHPKAFSHLVVLNLRGSLPRMFFFSSIFTWLSSLLSLTFKVSFLQSDFLWLPNVNYVLYHSPLAYRT